MSKSSVLAVLASAGIFLAGSVGADAAALAQAIQVGTPDAIDGFIAANPDSKLAPDAMVLAADRVMVVAERGGRGGGGGWDQGGWRHRHGGRGGYEG